MDITVFGWMLPVACPAAPEDSCALMCAQFALHCFALVIHHFAPCLGVHAADALLEEGTVLLAITGLWGKVDIMDVLRHDVVLLWLLGCKLSFLLQHVRIPP